MRPEIRETCKWCRAKINPNESYHNEGACDKCYSTIHPEKYKKCTTPGCETLIRVGAIIELLCGDVCEACWDKANPKYTQKYACTKCGAEIDYFHMDRDDGMCRACYKATEGERVAKWRAEQDAEREKNLAKIKELNLAALVDPEACSHAYYGINLRTGRIVFICRSEEESAGSCCKDGKCGCGDE
jgi:hypothetical protein